MTGKDIIQMSQQELKRLHVIRNVLSKVLKQTEASELLNISLRQIGRIVKRVSIDGDRGIVHKSRGRRSNRALPDRIKDRALKLFKDKYHDFGPVLASEKLFEIDKIKLSDETLRLWLIKANIPYRKRKKRPHRQWRERKEHCGQMVQMDGSHHNWFEGRGPECVLMGYIDDATNKPFARFYEYEGTIPAMDSFKRYVKRYGIPLSVYLDKHTTYKSTKKLSVEDELNDIQPLSQFERALGELGVEVIHANSPQAKGRIERLFNTLQDRLTKEMRLSGIKTIDQANKFLESYIPVYTKRFAIEPAKEANLHRPSPRSTYLDRILCIKIERALKNDFTILHNGNLYQILDNINAKKVTVEERVNGRLLIRYKGNLVRFKKITAKPRQQKEEEPKIKKIYIPPQDHPWRQYKDYPHINSYSQKEKVAQKEKGLLLTVT